MFDAFEDRKDAGERLARIIQCSDTAVVAGLARGGVAVGFFVARALKLPLVALCVRKLGAPNNAELAIGAVSETGEVWVDRSMAEATNASESYVRAEVEAQILEAQRRRKLYSIGPQPELMKGREVIVVDDGIATGATALVALQSARRLGASRIVLATPAASSGAMRTLQLYVDQAIVLVVPDPFLAVGMYYKRFGQIDDDEVIRYLTDANRDMLQT
ncbi:MAG: phosphoribosyltransferase [Chloroflexota bacterium]